MGAVAREGAGVSKYLREVGATSSYEAVSADNARRTNLAISPIPKAPPASLPSGPGHREAAQGSRLTEGGERPNESHEPLTPRKCCEVCGAWHARASDVTEDGLSAFCSRACLKAQAYELHVRAIARRGAFA